MEPCKCREAGKIGEIHESVVWIKEQMGDQQLLIRDLDNRVKKLEQWKSFINGGVAIIGTVSALGGSISSYLLARFHGLIR